MFTVLKDTGHFSRAADEMELNSFHIMMYKKKIDKKKENSNFRRWKLREEMIEVENIWKGVYTVTLDLFIWFLITRIRVTFYTWKGL